MWYIFPVHCEDLRFNHLTPLLVVTTPYALLILVTGILYLGLQVTSSISMWGCVQQDCLKGIEDLNLEHCLRECKRELYYCDNWVGVRTWLCKIKADCLRAICQSARSFEAPKFLFSCFLFFELAAAGLHALCFLTQTEPFHFPMQNQGGLGMPSVRQF